jgi:hypothetical protein
MEKDAIALKQDDVEKKIDHTATIKRKKEEFDNIIHHYLESNPFIKTDRKSSELELRFGTNKVLSKKTSKVDYDNVVKQLYACGFKTKNVDGFQILRINSEYINPRTGQRLMSNIRAEILGTDLIAQYCRTNSIQKIIDMPSTSYNKLKFTQKEKAVSKTGERINPLDMDEYNFRVSYQTEVDYNIQSQLSRNIVSKWGDSLKLFRFMNRVRFYHDDFPIFADLSIVKSSKTTNKTPIPQLTIQEAGVFTNTESYEIELEVDNSKMGAGSSFNSVKELMGQLRKCIRIVLSGLQGSKYPISYFERESVVQSYMKVVHGENYGKDETGKPLERPKRIVNSDFIGPSTYTLQMDNILESTEANKSANIRKNYTVTDKADGDRKLLYISRDGRLYMIDTNMNVTFTGAKTNEKTIFETIIDGEHIKTDKNGEAIQLYAAFDIYYIHTKSVREHAFIPRDDEEPDPEKKYRLVLLKQVIDLIKPISILESTEEVEPMENKKSIELRIVCKNFYYDSPTVTIFDGCSRIISNIKDGVFEYNTDGLIFTPANLAVGGKTEGGPPGPLSKITWDKSFKWKPPEFNTIDFLVSIKRDTNGKEEIHHKFEEGRNLQGTQEVVQYKTIELHCGFDERINGFLNPFQDVLDDNIPSNDRVDRKKMYKPVRFQPTDPFVPDAGYANIVLKDDGSKLFMTTEENEFFDENMIVEFKYDDTKEEGWKWIPLRVRYDKTADLQAGSSNYGNAYHVANNNWHSIHNPITEEMITSGNNIPEFIIREDVYYNRDKEETSTRSLRDFHNLFVKKRLIMGVANRGDTLVDYAVGKAGDLSKWMAAKLRFVFGIDISRDNIHNQLDGACVRYLKERRRTSESNMPRALFVVGNSSLNVRNGQALATEKDKQVTNAVFGKGPKDATLLGNGVIKQYGVAANGFQISSCQFAIHYFFENSTTFHNFLRNIAECTKVDGYFIATCYDGKTVFNKLKNISKDESITIFKNDRKIFEITKKYDQTGFPEDEMSLGYSIDVYQESINQILREYLVNFKYFTRIMEDYGFVLVTKEEANHMNLPDGSMLFSELFNYMELDIKMNPKKEADYGKALLMSPEEKTISFMNRYFVFKKLRNVDVSKMEEVILKKEAVVHEAQEEVIEEFENKVKEVIDELVEEEPTKPIVRKLKKEKVILKKFVPPPAETEPVENPKPIVAAPMKLKIRVPNA